MWHLKHLQPLLSQCVFLALVLFPFAQADALAKPPEKKLAPVTAAIEYEHRTLEDPGLRQYLETSLHQELEQWPLNDWNMEQLTAVAFYYHPDLEVARAKWRSAAGAIDTAKSRPNPIFQATPRYTHNADFGNSPWYQGFFSGFVIETAGKRKNRVAQAHHLSEMSRQGIAQSAWLIRSRLRNAVVTYLAGEKRMTLLSDQAAVQQALVKRLEQRTRVGESSTVESTQARVALAQTQLQLKEAERVRNESLAQVSFALGLSADAVQSLKIRPDWFEQPPHIEEIPRVALRREALSERADILSLLEEYEASHAALKLAVSKKYPDVRLGPGYIYNQGEHFYTIPVDLIFSQYYSNAGAVKEALARRSEVESRFLALQAQVIGETERAYIAYQAALAKITTAQELVTLQQQRAAIAQRLLNVGEGDALALNLVQAEIAAARISELDAIEKAQQTLNLLEDSIQRPIQSVRVVVPTFQQPFQSGIAP